jgi:hypothetical protein
MPSTAWQSRRPEYLISSATLVKVQTKKLEYFLFFASGASGLSAGGS